MFSFTLISRELMYTKTYICNNLKMDIFIHPKIFIWLKKWRHIVKQNENLHRFQKKSEIKNGKMKFLFCRIRVGCAEFDSLYIKKKITLFMLKLTKETWKTKENWEFPHIPQINRVKLSCMDYIYFLQF